VILHWDPDSGGMSRISDQEDPFHRELAVLLLNAKDGTSLDRLMRDILTRYVADRLPAPPR
jgi:hypothetical protein